MRPSNEGCKWSEEEFGFWISECAISDFFEALFRLVGKSAISNSEFRIPNSEILTELRLADSSSASRSLRLVR